MMLVRVTGKTFCAGVVFEKNRVVYAAPYLSKTLGWDRYRFAAHFRERGCRVEVVLERGNIELPSRRAKAAP